MLRSVCYFRWPRCSCAHFRSSPPSLPFSANRSNKLACRRFEREPAFSAPCRYGVVFWKVRKKHFGKRYSRTEPFERIRNRSLDSCGRINAERIDLYAAMNPLKIPVPFSGESYPILYINRTRSEGKSAVKWGSAKGVVCKDNRGMRQRERKKVINVTIFYGSCVYAAPYYTGHDKNTTWSRADREKFRWKKGLI